MASKPLQIASVREKIRPFRAGSRKSAIRTRARILFQSREVLDCFARRDIPTEIVFDRPALSPVPGPDFYPMVAASLKNGMIVRLDDLFVHAQGIEQATLTVGPRVNAYAAFPDPEGFRGKRRCRERADFLVCVRLLWAGAGGSEDE